MRKWGLVVTLFYSLILLCLVVPGAILIVRGGYPAWPGFENDLREVLSGWLAWIPIAALIASQALLLFLSVDTSQKRLTPRAHILVSCSVAGLLTAFLVSAAIWSLGFAIRGDGFWESLFDRERNILLFWAGLWLVWGVIFYLYFRGSSDAVSRVLSGLLRGSVLELLVAVPCHVIVRRRHDCSAPMVTSFGIATGVAIMLLSFGPSVFFLFRKRFNTYRRRSA